MGDHYYSQSPVSAHAVRAFTIDRGGKTLRFETDAGVFSKAHLDQGTALLLDALPAQVSGRALDLGCGWGAVGVCMAAQWPNASIVMTDVNERAVALARENLRRNGLGATVSQGDGLAHLEGTFDLIAVNPPIRAGKAVVHRLLAEGLAALSPGGAMYVVMRKQQGAESAQRFMQAQGATVDIVARGGGFRVFCAQRG